MKYFEITKGLDLPLAGIPVQKIESSPPVRHIAVTGPDYVGMKPTLAVEKGDKVLAGQVLFEDKKNPGVKFTSPGAGTVLDIYRGEKRAFRSVVIELANGKEADKSVAFPKYAPAELDRLTSEQVRSELIESGFWTALRTRPFSRIPAVGSTPSSLFVTAMDSNPHAPNAELIIKERPDDFVNGLKVLSKICGKKIWLCQAPNTNIPGGDNSNIKVNKVETAVFAGPHPAGLAGTHIHYLDPAGSGKTVWVIGYQDVLAIGKLFTTGQFPTERVISLGGPMFKKPRLIRTRLGASLSELTAGELKDGLARIISGSVLCGRALEDNGLCGLGRYALQISAIADGDPREFFGWLFPGFRKFSLARTVASYLLPWKRFPFKMNTAMHGGARAIYPNSMFYNLTPLELEPVFLFRALEIGDIEQAENLGVLELDEEDVALCTLVDFGKNDFGGSLRSMLNTIMKEEE